MAVNGGSFADFHIKSSLLLLIGAMSEGEIDLAKQVKAW